MASNSSPAPFPIPSARQLERRETPGCTHVTDICVRKGMVGK